MSETKFTKGEWLFNAHDGSITDKSVARNYIASVEIEGWDKLNMGYANANLIAASPNHDAALCMINDKIPLTSNVFGGDYMITLTQDEVNKIRFSLAKARGEKQ